MNYFHLSQEECNLLEKLGTETLFSPQQMIYQKGEEAQTFYYIKQGRVRIFDKTSMGREITVDVIEAGYIFGESGFCGNAIRPVNVQAINHVTLISLPISLLQELIMEHPLLAFHLLQMCSDSMDRLMNRLEEQCLLDRYGKTASYLLDITAVESEDRGTLGGEVPYTHTSVANSLGLNRTTVTEVLKYFEQMKWIRCGYGKIQVLNREGLEKFVKEQML